jgi:hypothetical protein
MEEVNQLNNKINHSCKKIRTLKKGTDQQKIVLVCETKLILQTVF